MLLCRLHWHGTQQLPGVEKGSLQCACRPGQSQLHRAARATQLKDRIPGVLDDLCHLPRPLGNASGLWQVCTSIQCLRMRSPRPDPVLRPAFAARAGCRAGCQAGLGCRAWRRAGTSSTPWSSSACTAPRGNPLRTSPWPLTWTPGHTGHPCLAEAQAPGPPLSRRSRAAAEHWGRSVSRCVGL